jgi:hypothetical protein
MVETVMVSDGEPIVKSTIKVFIPVVYVFKKIELPRIVTKRVHANLKTGPPLVIQNLDSNGTRVSKVDYTGLFISKGRV